DECHHKNCTDSGECADGGDTQQEHQQVVDECRREPEGVREPRVKCADLQFLVEEREHADVHYQQHGHNPERLRPEVTSAHDEPVECGEFDVSVQNSVGIQVDVGEVTRD